MNFQPPPDNWADDAAPLSAAVFTQGFSQEPPPVPALLKKAGSRVQRNFEILSTLQPTHAFPYFLFGMACITTSPTAYVDHLLAHAAPLKSMKNPPRGTLVSIMNNIFYKAEHPGIRQDTQGLSKQLGQAIASDIGLPFYTVFPPTKDYGLPADGMAWSHPGVESELKKEKPFVQAHFYELKKKYPEAAADWIFLLIARRIWNPVRPWRRQGSNSGFDDLAGYFAGKYRLNKQTVVAELAVIAHGDHYPHSRFLGFAAQELGQCLSTIMPLKKARHAPPGELTVRNTVPVLVLERAHNGETGLMGDFTRALACVQTRLPCGNPLPAFERFLAIHHMKTGAVMTPGEITARAAAAGRSLTETEYLDYAEGRAPLLEGTGRRQHPTKTVRALAAIVGESYTAAEMVSEWRRASNLMVQLQQKAARARFLPRSAAGAEEVVFD